jgi:tripartite-type tricarboxylate transporter receptor subunit TctC
MSPVLHRRRQFLGLALGALAAPLAARVARAQSYPTRPVRWVVGGTAGSPPDTLARLLGQWLSGRLGQPFVIENRPGSGGNIGTAAAVRAPSDGYTLLLVSTTNAISATLYVNLSFDFIRDISPVAGIARVPLVLVADPTFPARTVPELIAYAKAHPGKISMASAGNGTSPHVSGELFKMMAGIELVHVPYRSGAPALTDVIGGQVEIMFDTVISSIEHIRAGQLRPLATTGATRWKDLPDVPAMKEFLADFEASAWFGVGAPAATPHDIIDRLNSEINAGLADAKISRQLGDTALAMSADEFGRLVAQETKKWTTVVRTANLKPD